MKITINIDELSKTDEMMTYHDIQRFLYQKIVNECDNTNTKKIITNTKIASVLQDVVGYIINPKISLETDGKIYQMGTISDIAIYVDPHMSWNDNRIILTTSLRKKREDKLLRIFKEKVTERVTEIEIIDNKEFLI